MNFGAHPIPWLITDFWKSPLTWRAGSLSTAGLVSVTETARAFLLIEDPVNLVPALALARAAETGDDRDRLLLAVAPDSFYRDALVAPAAGDIEAALLIALARQSELPVPLTQIIYDIRRTTGRGASNKEACRVRAHRVTTNRRHTACADHLAPLASGLSGLLKRTLQWQT